MKRRAFVTVVGAALTSPLAVKAQQASPTPQSGKTFRIGLGFVVSEAIAKEMRQAFLAGLHDHGYVVGHNLVFDVRYADGDIWPTARADGRADRAQARCPRRVRIGGPSHKGQDLHD